MPRVGVTRNAEQLGSLTERAAERGIEIVPLPVLSIHPVHFEWPLSTVKPDGVVDWIAFSSPQGVRSFFSGVESAGAQLDDHVRAAVIGGRTAASLSQIGIKAGFIPSRPYGKRLFEELLGGVMHSGEILVYARAEEISFDPVALFRDSGIAYFPVICYKAEPVEIDPELAGSLNGEDIVLFTAPSAVQAYHRQFGTPRARVLAIGETTASEMDNLNWPDHDTMTTPDVDAILEYV